MVISLAPSPQHACSPCCQNGCLQYCVHLERRLLHYYPPPFPHHAVFTMLSVFPNLEHGSTTTSLSRQAVIDGILSHLHRGPPVDGGQHTAAAKQCATRMTVCQSHVQQYCLRPAGCSSRCHTTAHTHTAAQSSWLNSLSSRAPVLLEAAAPSSPVW